VEEFLGGCGVVVDQVGEIGVATALEGSHGVNAALLLGGLLQLQLVVDVHACQQIGDQRRLQFAREEVHLVRDDLVDLLQSVGSQQVPLNFEHEHSAFGLQHLLGGVRAFVFAGHEQLFNAVHTRAQFLQRGGEVLHDRLLARGWGLRHVAQHFVAEFGFIEL